MFGAAGRKRRQGLRTFLLGGPHLPERVLEAAADLPQCRLSHARTVSAWSPQPPHYHTHPLAHLPSPSVLPACRATRAHARVRSPRTIPQHIGPESAHQGAYCCHPIKRKRNLVGSLGCARSILQKRPHARACGMPAHTHAHAPIPRFPWHAPSAAARVPAAAQPQLRTGGSR